MGHLLDALRDGQGIQAAVETAFGADGETLERDWRGSIPAVLTSGLPRNVLIDGNLRVAQQAAADQRWTDAADKARVAEQFWNNIGHAGRAAEARALADIADAVVVFGQADEQAQQRLLERRYREAIETASSGLQRLPDSADPSYRTQLQTIVQRAEAGLQGEESLKSARALMGSYQIIEAQRLASLAEQQLILAGDETRIAEARDLRGQAQGIQQLLATGALIVALLSGGALWLNRTRSSQPVTIGSRKQEVRL
jgi:hypothetical protein